MRVPGVTGSGAEGAGNSSRGDRDGASDGSGAVSPGGIPPQTGDRSGSTASERGGLGGGGGDGRVFPSPPPPSAGGVGGGEFPSLPPQGQEGSDGRAFPSIPPQGQGGSEGRAFPSIPPQGVGGVDGRAFSSPPPQGVEDGAGGVFPPPPPRPLGERDQAVPPLPWGPYDGRARAARAAGPHRTPPHGGGDRAPQGAQDAAALSAALRDSLDALISPLHERVSFIETAIGTTRRSRRRRRRMSSSSSDVEYSGGDGGRHVPRRAVARSLGRELEGDPRRRLPEKIIPADDRYAQRKGDVCRRRHEEQQAEDARRAEARRERRAAWPTPRKYVSAAVAVPTKVGKVPSGPSPRGEGRFGQPRNYNFLACNMRGHFFRECPRLDAATRAVDAVNCSSKVRILTRRLRSTMADLFLSILQPITALRLILIAFNTIPKCADGDHI